jgi:guanosine-diphosphatase
MSVSLPTKHLAHDPHEKPDRYDTGDRDSSFIMKMQSAWASQSQRARYIKTGAIIFVVFLLFYVFSPSGVDIYHEGRLARKVGNRVMRAVADLFL